MTVAYDSTFTSIWGASATDIYASAAYGPLPARVQHTTDGGNTWVGETLPIAAGWSATNQVYVWGSGSQDVYAIVNANAALSSTPDGGVPDGGPPPDGGTMTAPPTAFIDHRP